VTWPARLRSRGFRAIAALCFLGFLLPSFFLSAAEREAPKPTAKDKCPVCGMFVSKYPDWTTAIFFKDGSHVFLDGAKDMFKYLLDSKRYDPAKKTEDIQAVMVMHGEPGTSWAVMCSAPWAGSSSPWRRKPMQWSS
jgi:nitrous oxide reductase accessory protein NosL